MKPTRVLASLDWWLVLIAVAIAWLGVTLIDSATSTEHAAGFHGQDLRQVLGLAVAAAAGLLLILVPYLRIMRLWPYLYAAALLALVAVLLFGVVRNGSRRWLGPTSVQIQPSEFAKLAVIVTLAAYLRLKTHAKTWEGLLAPLLLTLAPAVLVLLQPDLSTSLVLWPIWLAMCFVAGAPRRSLVVLLLVAALGMFLAYKGLHDYQVARISVWLDHWSWDDDLSETVRAALRDKAYQPWQSLIAIGSGGWSGQGLYEGPQNVNGFLPYRSEDYIFSVACEELGFLGAAGLLALQMGLACGCLAIGARTRERFGRLLCVGVGVMLATQTLVHASVCAWLLPSTGLPMPLVSAGRSSLLTTTLSLALVLNVGARKEPVLASDGFA